MLHVLSVYHSTTERIRKNMSKSRGKGKEKAGKQPTLLEALSRPRRSEGRGRSGAEAGRAAPVVIDLDEEDPVGYHSVLVPRLPYIS